MSAFKYATEADCKTNIQLAGVIKQLEVAHAGAKMVNDYDAQTRIARAIAMLKTPSNIQPFTDEFVDSYLEKECAVDGVC